MAVHPTSGSNYMLAGAQDNGTHKFTTAGINSVTSPTGGDGGFCFINQSNPNYQVTSFTAANYTRSTNGGTSFAQVVSLNNSGLRFINPADIDNTANFLYFSYLEGMYGHFDITNGSAGSETLIDLQASPSSLSLTNLQVSAIKVDADTTNTIWLGFSTSTTGADAAPCLVKVIKANGPGSGNPNLKPVGTKFNLPGSIPAGAYISSIDIESGNRNHLLITISNYGVTSVWESTDGGTSWTSVEGNLPDMPVRWGIFIPSGYLMRTESVGGVMLATELGVWTTPTLNGSSTVWTANNSGLANVRTDQLVLRSSDKLVAAATHGRGVFTTTLLTAPLPVTLINFTGRLQNAAILLEWSTASEFNSSHFELERSYDGVIFHKIAAIQAAGNSNVVRQYSYTDRESLSELNYYRLKMFDIDAKYKLSGTVLIRNTAVSQNVFIIGNPVHDELNIRFARIPQTKVSVRLLDMNGKILANKEFERVTQSSLHPGINMANFSKGVYTLQVNADDNTFINRLVKQ
jgi:hypothetical protein